MHETKLKYVRESIAEAIEDAKFQSGSPRLIPFTSAQIGFIEEVISGALTRLLLADQA
ncbi:uncharacterized protein METZ01_LOCUS494833 [marine metagenome]|jgi:hypothetical protein|uniref:Uncharacterized protein n=1 Tax=marine metagenome TaxID=408172 RepID=A0A383DCG5_9ZZZZ